MLCEAGMRVSVIQAINWFNSFSILIHDYREGNRHHHHADLHRIEVASTVRRVCNNFANSGDGEIRISGDMVRGGRRVV